MRSARYYGRGDIRIEDIPAPELRPGTVGIDVAFCGICGTDLHEYLDGPIFIPAAGHPHPISGEAAPITIGHEMSGVVYAVSPDVHDLAPGDRVVVEPYILHDDVDTSAANNAYHLSPDMNFIGLGGGGGGLAEKIVVERRWVHAIGDIPLDEAALIEPLSVGYHAFERSGAKAGDFALIGGAGPIGLLTAAVLTAMGLKVAITELSPLRRQKALNTGVAQFVFDPSVQDVAKEVRALTNGLGADVAFEATSVNVVLDTLLDAVRPQATIVNISIWGHPASVDMQKLVLKELNLMGTIAYVNSHPAAIALVREGKVNLAPFITDVIGLDDLIEKGFDTLINRNETAVKILVDPRLRS